MLKTLVWDSGRRGARDRARGATNGRFREVTDPAEVRDLLGREQQLLWIDLTAPSEDELRLVAEEFGLHPLAVEDAIKQSQRPKIDEYENFYLMVVFAIERVGAGETVSLGAGAQVVGAESAPAPRKGAPAVTAGLFRLHEIDIFVGQRFLITVHAEPLAVLQEVEGRWGRNSRAIDEGAGTLLYTLLDSIVDQYFPVLDDIVERVEALEEQFFAETDRAGQRSDMQRLFQVKRDLLQLRRVLAPERDALLVLARQELPIFDRRVAVYFQDVYDHVVRVTDAIDVCQDLLTNVLESYLSLVSNNLNQVMKLLTALTVILMVPTLIAGIYGMNFEYMPELRWPYGYPVTLGAMALSMLVLFSYFRRKGWI
jgi:magnesium transporter